MSGKLDTMELVDCDYTDATVENVVFIGYKIKNPIFVRTKFVNVVFLNCVLINPDFSHSSMHVKFTECALIGAIFQGADMKSVIMERTKPIDRPPQHLSQLIKSSESLPEPIRLKRVRTLNQRFVNDEIETDTDDSSDSDSFNEFDEMPAKKKRVFPTCDICSTKHRGAKDSQIHKTLFANLPFTCAEYTTKCIYCHYKFVEKASSFVRLRHAAACPLAPTECKKIIEDNFQAREKIK